MPNLLRCTRWRVVARTEYEAGIAEHTLTPQEQSSTGDNICVELISAATVKPGDELELSAVIVATLTGTETLHQGPCALDGSCCRPQPATPKAYQCVCGGDFGIRCGACGREYQCTQCSRWCRKSELRYDAKMRCPVCTGHALPEAAPILKVPRRSIRWWGDGGVYHGVVNDGPARDGICGAYVPYAATATDLVQERKCCLRCLQRIDYGEQPAAAGA